MIGHTFNFWGMWIKKGTVNFYSWKLKEEFSLVLDSFIQRCKKYTTALVFKEAVKSVALETKLVQ